MLYKSFMFSESQFLVTPYHPVNTWKELRAVPTRGKNLINRTYYYYSLHKKKSTRLHSVPYFSSIQRYKNKRKGKIKDIQHIAFEGKIIKISRAALSTSTFWVGGNALSLHWPVWEPLAACGHSVLEMWPVGLSFISNLILINWTATCG